LDKLVAAIVAKLAPIIIEKLSALLPVIAAAVAKAVMDEIRKVLPGVSVPLMDLADLTEQIRSRVSAFLPDGVDIPHITDVLDPNTWGQR
jgi:tRNA pseudouridine-54 N-methylase